MMWERSDALDIVKAIETAIADKGWHVALGGSVLCEGGSENDLDILLYRHTPGNPDWPPAVLNFLESLGFTPRDNGKSSGEADFDLKGKPRAVYVKINVTWTFSS